jgi:catechol 2,3-dioxygenase-like lactoylglutathione lyase family enzyme
MRLNSTVLFVRDIECSKAFYVKLLGQTILYDFGKNVQFHGGLCIWQADAQHIICQELTQRGSENNIELYFEDEQIAEIVQLLKTENVDFLHDMHEECWGQRTVRFFDPDRHLIEIGEPMPVFVKRLYNSGMSLELVSEKTGISVEQVEAFLAI